MRDFGGQRRWATYGCMGRMGIYINPRTLIRLHITIQCRNFLPIIAATVLALQYMYWYRYSYNTAAATYTAVYQYQY